MTVDVAVVPYSTIILHCLKYPHNGVLGILLGSRSGSKVKVSAAVPLSHESSPLAPSLEVALAVIHASYPNIVGVYFSNQNYKDKRLSCSQLLVSSYRKVLVHYGKDGIVVHVFEWRLLYLNRREIDHRPLWPLSVRGLNPYAIRLCENVTSVCGTNAILMQVINWNLSADCESNSLEAYVKDGENWKDTRLDTSSDSLATLSRAIYNKLYRSLSDFENHLDRPENDFYNTILSEKLIQLTE